MMIIKYNYIVFFFLSIQISEQITNYLIWICVEREKKKEVGWVRVFSMSSS